VAEAEQHRAYEQARKATESREQSRHLLYDADMNLAQQAMRQNNLGRARRLLDRHKPAPGEDDLRGWEWRYLWQLTRSSALTLTNRPTRGFSVGFSQDGTRLGIGWYNGCVELWDVPRRQLIQTLTDRTDLPAAHVAFSPVRNLMAATAEANTVRLYDLGSNKESILWRAPPEGQWQVTDLAFSPDGSRLMIYAIARTESCSNSVWLVNMPSLKIESCHPVGGAPDEFLAGARISPDNQRLYLPISDATSIQAGNWAIRCEDLTTGRDRRRTDPVQADDGLIALAVSPDGRVLVSGYGFLVNDVHVWDTATGRPLARLQGHTGFVDALAFTKDGRRLISASGDQTIRLWDTATWAEVKVLRGHRSEAHGVAVSEAAHLMASAGKDGDVMLWSDDVQGTNDGYFRLPEKLRNYDIGSLARSQVMILPSGESPELFNLATGSRVRTLSELGGSSNTWPSLFTDANTSVSRPSVASTGWICRWDGTNQILVESWDGSRFNPRGAVRMSASGARPVFVAWDPARSVVAWAEPPASNTVFIAALEAPHRRRQLNGDVDFQRSGGFSADGKYLILHAPCAHQVWNVETGQIQLTLREIWNLCMAFASTGHVVVAAVPDGRDHEIRFYDLDHPERPPRSTAGRHGTTCLAISPDGRFVAASDIGGVVRLFDAHIGGLIADMHSHSIAVSSVAFSADGRRLISASGGNEAVKLWDVSTRQELLTLPGAAFRVSSAGWSTDGDTIYVGSVIGVPARAWPPQAWHAPSWEEIAAAEANEQKPTP
jgi:WD40 repeat protein